MAESRSFAPTKDEVRVTRPMVPPVRPFGNAAERIAWSSPEQRVLGSHGLPHEAAHIVRQRDGIPTTTQR